MEQPILYYSTNRNLADAGECPFRRSVALREALFRGLAPDGGLFMPERLPAFEPAFFESLRDAPYAEIAYRVLRPFTAGTLPDDAARALCEDAYTFEVPVEWAGDRRYVLRLDRGPTASFKDFAARWMARAMHALRAEESSLTVLVATSGDTGSAVGDAFRGLPGVRVYLLYPEDEVSPLQKLQLDTIGDNVQSLSLDGTFDQCQALVKQAFLDPALAGLHLASANSINIGRILPQCVYYFYAWSRVAEAGEPVIFSVPSGNFGNSFGAELARRMGLPVERLLLAVNANDEFPRFLATGAYAPVSPSRACLSNAMNVGNPSNLARYFELYGGTVTRDGAVRRAPDLDALRARIESISVSDEETIACMRRVHRERGVLLEPHGAVGWAALDRAGLGEDQAAICLETAHPAKFPEAVERATGLVPEPPAALRGLDRRAGGSVRIEADYGALKAYLRKDAKG